MKAIITVGLGFGDEGKGATVDYLTRTLQADLVVRYCGGAQAGHNVVLPDGRRHNFAQFGAGTLAGAATYLGPRMVISPSTVVPEAEHLQELGVSNPLARLSVHPQCLVATVYHSCLNRLRELARGADRHGSCGLGIGETRSYWLRYGADAIVAEDLRDRRQLTAKLALLRDRCLLDMQELPKLDRTWSALLHESMPPAEAEHLMAASAALSLRDRLPDCRTAIFEGAQGILLDEWRGFHPHTTWSTVTPQHAWEILAELGVTDAPVWGITRAYMTRHGAGPFPTHDAELTRSLRDPGNPTNDWQGTLRSGPLDLVLLDYASRIAQVDAIVVNHLDQLPAEPRICTAYAGVELLEIPGSIREQEALTRQLQRAVPQYQRTSRQEMLERIGQIAPIAVTADGPAHGDRRTATCPTGHTRRRAVRAVVCPT